MLRWEELIDILKVRIVKSLKIYVESVKNTGTPTVKATETAAPQKIKKKMAITENKFYQPLIKYYGGKGGKQINKWILSHFPANYAAMHYLEGAVGGGSIFFNKDKPLIGVKEQLNDINPKLIYLYRDLRDFGDLLISDLERVEYTEETFNTALDKENISLSLSESAKFYIRHRMSRAGMGRDFCWSSRTRRGMPEAISAWKTSLAQLKDLSLRLKNVRITNKDIIQLLDTRRHRNDLFTYIDLPYTHCTRSKSAHNIYDFECTHQTHIDLCSIVTAADFLPSILISGYQNELYSNTLEKCGFTRHELVVANHAAQNSNKKKKVECVWKNY